MEQVIKNWTVGRPGNEASEAGSVSVFVCFARAGSEISLASQLQVRTSEDSGCYRRSQQVRRMHAVMYTLVHTTHSIVAKLCGSWLVPGLNIPTSIGVRVLAWE